MKIGKINIKPVTYNFFSITFYMQLEKKIAYAYSWKNLYAVEYKMHFFIVSNFFL